MSIQNNPLTRRTVLRGMGISFGLPWLESLASRSVSAQAATVSQGAPQRMAFIFVPNGVHLDDWTPQR